jgi:D-glycero-alpha-D-manno-heptose 1-phosphate guanylyltransferase
MSPLKTQRDTDVTSAVVLAGGLGTRLRPAFAVGPKSLAPIAGKPFLGYLLGWLASSGVRDVILCVGYRAAQIQEYAGGGETWGLGVRYSVEDNPLGTGGALKKAEGLLSGDCVFVINGDTYLDVDLAQMLAFHRQRNALVTIAAAQVSDPERYGTLQLGESGRVESFAEKRARPETRAHEQGAFINGGVYVFSRECLARIPPDCGVSLEREVLPGSISTKHIFGFATEGYFLDIGIENDYNRAQTELIERFSNSYTK